MVGRIRRIPSIIAVLLCVMLMSTTVLAATYETVDLSNVYNANNAQSWFEGETIGFVAVTGYGNWFDDPSVEFRGIPFQMGPSGRGKNVAMTTNAGTQTITVPIGKKIARAFLAAASGWTITTEIGGKGVYVQPSDMDVLSVEVEYTDGTVTEVFPTEYPSGVERILDWTVNVESFNEVAEEPVEAIQVPDSANLYVFSVEADPAKTVKEIRVNDKNGKEFDDAGEFVANGIAICLAAVTVELP